MKARRGAATFLSCRGSNKLDTEGQFKRSRSNEQARARQPRRPWRLKLRTRNRCPNECLAGAAAKVDIESLIDKHQTYARAKQKSPALPSVFPRALGLKRLMMAMEVLLYQAARTIRLDAYGVLLCRLCRAHPRSQRHRERAEAHENKCPAWGQPRRARPPAAGGGKAGRPPTYSKVYTIPPIT